VDDERLSIGRFAKLCRLSVKALRHYDELGLLRPAHVDPSSGYRSYRRAQVRRALAIGMLRELDVPLSSVREILDGGGDRAIIALESEARRQARELARRQVILASLTRLVRERSLAPHAVELVETPECRLLVLRRTASVEDQEDVTTEAVRVLMRTLETHRIGWRDPVVCRFHETSESDDQLALEIGVGIGDADVAPRLLEGAHVLTLPRAGRAACARHIGPYASLGLAHHAVYAWARERGLEPAGPLYEVYVNDPDDVAPEALITEVRLPLAGSDEAIIEQEGSK
jgi:DNA-binding transcriptional MerR regulator